MWARPNAAALTAEQTQKLEAARAYARTTLQPRLLGRLADTLDTPATTAHPSPHRHPEASETLYAVKISNVPIEEDQEELKSEFKEECEAKCGAVDHVELDLIQDTQTCSVQVYFRSKDAAVAAINMLQGRFFSGFKLEAALV